jgi:hypothetical protein
MKKRMISIFILLTFLCVGCYDLQIINQRIDDVYANLKKVEIGMNETSVFPVSPAQTESMAIFPRDQICEVTEYKAEGYNSRTYYVGYMSYGNCNWVASIDCVNGKVSSIFYF